MARPLLKTAATSLKMTPEVRQLWERCAEAENRTLSNMFEVMVREHAKKLSIEISPVHPVSRTPRTKSPKKR
jgi:hypothetical protein